MATPAPRRSLPLVYEREPEPQAEIVFVHVLAEPSFYRRHGKRALDLVLTLPLCLIAAPLVAVLAAAVVLTSGWPAFYGARRVGLNGKPFLMWKLRTMVKDADCLPDQWRESEPELAEEYTQNFKLKLDPRVTRLGRWLRRTSMDELPQLLSVLRGEMSLVGPRPIVKDELINYGRDAGKFLSVRPGMTGYWQLGGRNAIDYPERTSIELQYASNLSLGEDVQLLARTVPSVLFKPNGL